MELSREIKYRVWNERYKEYAYWGFFDLGFTGIPTGGGLSIEECQKTSQQFIGTKDRNNKEIYEGDIRREEIEFEDGDEIHYYVCVWINEWSMFAWLSATDGEYQKYLSEGAESLDTTSYWTYPASDGDRQDIVVCGNIFEHPHLLEHSIIDR